MSFKERLKSFSFLLAALCVALPACMMTYPAQAKISANYSDGAVRIGAATEPGFDGLVGYWALDETTGTSAADSSGQGNNGTLFNTPSWTTSGQINGALSFDGTGNYVSTSTQSIFDQVPFTVSAWVKYSALPSATGHLLSIAGGSQNSAPWTTWSLWTQWTGGFTDYLVFELVDASGSLHTVESDAAITAGPWYHVVGVADSSYNMKLYINGVQQTTTANSGSLYNAPTFLAISATSGGGGFNGLIDDVRIYNRALSAAEITTLYGTLNATDACGGTNEGAIRYNVIKHWHEYCNGTAWTQFVGSSASGTPSTPPTGAGYFVITSGIWNGNLGGGGGANAKCLTDLTNNTWLGKTDATTRGLLTSDHVKAWICPSTACQNAVAGVTYYFAVSGDASAGGASFTADANGLGTGNSQSWSGTNYFNGAQTYWTGFGNAATNTSWGGISGGSASEVCYNGAGGGNWFQSSSGVSAVIGTAASSDVSRWSMYLHTCDTLNHLVCFVNP